MRDRTRQDQAHSPSADSRSTRVHSHARSHKCDVRRSCEFATHVTSYTRMRVCFAAQKTSSVYHATVITMANKRARRHTSAQIPTYYAHGISKTTNDTVDKDGFSLLTEILRRTSTIKTIERTSSLEPVPYCNGLCSM